MSLEQHVISDFSKVLSVAKDLHDKGDAVFLLFMAARREDGVRWCPDCVNAEPVVDAFLKQCSFKKNVHVIIVDLERSYFKDSSNPYYTSEEFALRKVPTMMAWKGEKKLLEEECMKEDLLKELFQSVL